MDIIQLGRQIQEYFIIKGSAYVDFLLRINQAQKEMSPITNLIFFFLIYMLLSLRYYVVRIILNFSYTLYSSIATKKLRKKIEVAKKMLNDNIISQVEQQKYKRVVEFKNEKQDLIYISNRITKLSEGNEVNLNRSNGKRFHNEDNKDAVYIASKASEYFSFFNLLHPDVFASSRMSESEVIKICLERFNGIGEDFCGSTTFNPMESNILAIRAYKNYASHIKNPEVLIPESCPSMYHKISMLLDVKLTLVPVDEEGRMKITAFQKISYKRKNNIIAVIAFYPNFTFGIADRIDEISNICKNLNLPLHVDATYGGFISAYKRNISLANTGLNQKFDFSLPGVTSLTSDLSKYAMAPIGISFLAYRSRQFRKHQYYIYPKFQGGIYATPGLSGSKVATFVLTSYMNFVHFGHGKYESNSAMITKTVEEISKGIRTSFGNDIAVIGNPELCIISFTSNTISIAHLYESLRKKNWDLMLRFKKEKIEKTNKESILNKDSLSLIITACNCNELKTNFINNLKESIKDVKANSVQVEGKKESNLISSLRFISHLPIEAQVEVLRDYSISQLDMK